MVKCSDRTGPDWTGLDPVCAAGRQTNIMQTLCYAALHPDITHASLCEGDEFYHSEEIKKKISFHKVICLLFDPISFSDYQLL